MKIKLQTIVIIILLSIVFSFAGSYLYNNFRSSQETPHVDKVLNHLKDSLLLSDDQLCRMKECQTCFKDSLSRVTCMIHQKRFELIKILKEKNPDINRVHQIMNEIDTLQSASLHQIVDNILDQKNILDDSQKEKFFKMLLSQVADESKSCMIEHKH